MFPEAGLKKGVLLNFNIIDIQSVHLVVGRYLSIDTEFVLTTYLVGT
jgi:hypothetical protein